MLNLSVRLGALRHRGRLALDAELLDARLLLVEVRLGDREELVRLGPPAAMNRFKGMLHATEVGQRMIDLISAGQPAKTAVRAP